MLITAVANRVNAYLCRHSDPKSSAAYFFISAASLLVAAAALLRVMGLTQWSEQAPWMMLIPIGYLIGSRLWRGHSAERPLYWVAQVATIVILLHVFGATMQDLRTVCTHGRFAIEPDVGTRIYRGRGLLLPGRILPPLGPVISIWQQRPLAGRCGSFLDTTASTSDTTRCSMPGWALPACVASRAMGLERIAVYRLNNLKTWVPRGRGLHVFQCGNGILSVACLAALMQGLAGLATNKGGWLDIVSLLVYGRCGRVGRADCAGPQLAANLHDRGGCDWRGDVHAVESVDPT